MKKIVSLLALGSGLTMLASADQILYFQGYETDTSGWQDINGGTPTITRTMGNAADGNWKGVVSNTEDEYQSGFGEGGFDRLGRTPGTSLPYPGGPFYQSMDIYINPSTMAPTDPSTAAFWLDAAPSDASGGGSAYGAEHDFAFFYDGTTTTVKADDGNGATLATITMPGWYDFQFLYSPSDSNPTDISNTTLSVLGPGGTVLGSTTRANDFTDGSTVFPLENQNLGGPGYEWLTVWQDGFSNNTLSIDDVQAVMPTPEPASYLLIGVGVSAILVLRRRLF